MFKKFLEKKGISQEQFEGMNSKEVADLQNEYNEQKAADMKEEFKGMIDNAKKGLLDEDALESKLKEFGEKMVGQDSEEFKGLKETVEKNQGIIADYKEKLKEQGKQLHSLKHKGIFNEDFSVNKGVIRTLVEKHLTDAGLICEKQVNENGIEVQEVKLKSNQKLGDSATAQIADVKSLSKKNLAQKAGEAVYIGGTGTQAVFGQAVNRTSIGTISNPLTADEHALDIFKVTNITGSLMNLLVYENLEANGEIVAEGTAPSADSRIELNDKDFKVFDFSATATISKNLLRDKNEVIDELVEQLESNLKTVLDTILFTDGGDNTNSPWGVLNTTHSCEAFNPLLFAGTSPKANIVSVIGKAKLQARLNNWSTDSTILNPNQWDSIEDLKDANENSVRDNRLAVNAVGETIAVKGMFKHQTTKMPQGSLLVFNSGLQNIGLRQDVETQFGHNNDDFKKRRVAFVMDMRGAYGQKAHKSAIYVDSIADAIAILKETATTSLNRVKGYATGSDATALTTAVLINSGASSIDAEKLGAYKTAIASEASIADLAALQAVVDTVNAA